MWIHPLLSYCPIWNMSTASSAFNSLCVVRRSLLQAAAVVMRDGPLIVLGGADMLCDSRVLVVPVVVAPHLLGIVQELPGKQRLHLKHMKVPTSPTALNHDATTYEPEEEKLLLAHKKEWIFKNATQKKTWQLNRTNLQIFKSSWKASLTSPVATCRSSGAHWWIYRVLAEVLVFRPGLLPGQWGSVWASAGPDTRPRSSAGSGSVVAVARGARSSESLIRRRNRFLQLMNWFRRISPQMLWPLGDSNWKSDSRRLCKCYYLPFYKDSAWGACRWRWGGWGFTDMTYKKKFCS